MDDISARYGGGGRKHGGGGISVRKIWRLAFLKRRNERIHLEFHVLSRGSQISGHVGVAQVPFAGNLASIRRFDEHEDVGVGDGAQFHRRLHENGSEGHLHALELRYEIQEVAR